MDSVGGLPTEVLLICCLLLSSELAVFIILCISRWLSVSNAQS